MQPEIPRLHLNLIDVRRLNNISWFGRPRKAVQRDQAERPWHFAVDAHLHGKGLERDGLLTRTVYPTTPPGVDYELTPLGSTLWKALEPFANWARAHGEIMAARNDFDTREGSV